jgi:hypothetical protein
MRTRAKLAEEVRPDTNGLKAGALESCAFIRQLRRICRSREAGTGMDYRSFLIQNREIG